MLVLDGKTLVYDRPFSHDGINYPANWLRLTTLAEKEAIGITEVANPVTPSYDQRFWWGVGNPKDLEQLKTTWKEKTSASASSLLAPSDWYAIRKADTGAAIPADWSTWRQSIRDAASAKELAIDLHTDVSEFEAYITTSTGAESDYSFWPADPNQPVVEASDEEVTTEPEVVSGGTVVTGGVVDDAGEDVISL